MHYNDICNFCGKFMSYKQMRNGVTWTPYGGVLDIDPPDHEASHITCWNNAKPSEVDLIRRIAWIAPQSKSKMKQ
jgi:hypothetical protein